MQTLSASYLTFLFKNCIIRIEKPFCMARKERMKNMIAGKCSELKLYENLHPRFAKAIDFLETLMAQDPADGRYVMPECEIPEEIYINVMHYDAKPHEAAKMEYHKKYIDVQVIVEGEEMMLLPADHLSEEMTPYQEAKDCGFMKMIPESECHRIVAKAGSFCVFFPGEEHAPSLENGKPSHVSKMVLKILM